MDGVLRTTYTQTGQRAAGVLKRGKLAMILCERAWSEGLASLRQALLGRLAAVDRMQFLAGFEAHRLAGDDADLFAGAGIAADAGFPGADAEDAEAAQLDALTGGKSLFEALEDCIHGRLRLGAGQASTLNHMMDDVLLNQWGTSLAQLN